MEKFEEEREKQYSKDVWDCGSTLYDSHELISFKRQLDSAIANSPRALSMPHLTERRVTVSSTVSLQVPHDIDQQRPSSCMFNGSFKISRTFQKLLRFVFKSGNKSRVSSSWSSRSNSFRSVVAEAEKYPKDRYCNMVYDHKSTEPVLLSTIPEHPDSEIGGISPDISNFVRKSASERFTATAIGISCA